MEHELDYEHRLTEVEQRSKSNTKRLGEVDKRLDAQDKLVESVTALATKQECMEGDVKEIKADVKSLAAKPGKRWDTLVDKIVWAVLAAVIAFLLGRIGL